MQYRTKQPPVHGNMNKLNSIGVHELNLDMIHPSTTVRNGLKNGFKLVVIGKPGSGKSTLIRALLYAKHQMIPCGLIISGTEASAEPSDRYSQFFPDCFIHNVYDAEIVEQFLTRQRIAKEHLPNPWAMLLLDDCTEDPKILHSKTINGLMKNGRHFSLLFILSLQYAMDVRPAFRVTIDGAFLFREPNIQMRKKLYDNFASIIPDFDTFCTLMDEITGDYTALYIHSFSQSNRWQDCVFYFKATPPPPFQFGNEDFRRFHNERYNPDYKDDF